MKSTYVNVADIWHRITKPKVNVAGTWRDVSNQYVNVAGVWKVVYQKYFDIPYSLLIDSNNDEFATRTPSVSSNNQVTTLSVWVKKTVNGTFQYLYSVSSAWNIGVSITFTSSNKLEIKEQNDSNVVTYNYVTTDTFDQDTWYNIIINVDTTQAISSDRIKIYVDGTRITTFDTEIEPAQYLNTYFNSDIRLAIGRKIHVTSGALDAYLAEVHYVDGASLDPTVFGIFDTSSKWQPVDAYYNISSSVGYGINGVYLPFTDGTNTNTILYDYSGNTNHLTPSGFVVVTQSADTPTA